MRSCLTCICKVDCDIIRSYESQHKHPFQILANGELRVWKAIEREGVGDWRQLMVSRRFPVSLCSGDAVEVH